MAFCYWINPHLGFLVNALLAGHPDALAALVEFQAVILADQVVAFQISPGERKQAVRTAVFKSREGSVGLAIEHDGLAANRASKRRMLDFVIPGDCVPRVSQKHRSAPCSCSCFIPRDARASCHKCKSIDNPATPRRFLCPPRRPI